MQLNPQQLAAINHLQGPSVVFAGAGAGKTLIMVRRISKLIDEHNIDPRSICALTFTNKAANEMKERAINLSAKSKFSLISTFHSAAVRWLKEYSHHIGYDKNFTILDTRDSDAVIKTVIKKLKEQLEKSHTQQLGFDSASAYSNEFRKLKIRGLLPGSEYTKNFCKEHSLVYSYEVYSSYQASLKHSNCMDFTDLLLNTIELLTKHEKIRTILSDRYQFLMIDEYQDVNPLQFKIITHLTRVRQNLMVVGDDDQSIYSWRGADPSNILNFTQTYPQAKVYRLEHNYRSSANIINAANSLIANNAVRVSKKLLTGAEDGQLITVYRAQDNAQEADYVCKSILFEVNNSDGDLRDYAIFYRTNAQSREIEDRLMHYHIPYKIYGSLRFYDRMEIKDVLAYFRLAINKKDDRAFLRIIKAPSCGMGAKSLQVLSDIAARYQLSLYNAVEMISNSNDTKKICDTKELKYPLIKKIKNIYRIYSAFFDQLLSDSAAKAVQNFMKYIPYAQYLKKSYPDMSKDKIDNIIELGVGMDSYFEENPDSDLSSWLQNVSLSGSEKESVQGVSLMTLHSAKGLEFNRVFMIGCDDGKLPHVNSMNIQNLLEEERRLFYVGMTRAKNKLTMTTATIVNSYQGKELAIPSRFIEELPQNKLQMIGDFYKKKPNDDFNF